MAPTGVPNALSFDLEHWHSATLLRDRIESPTDELRGSVEIVLELLERHDVRATFFTVGEVAREYPDVVAAVADSGHEIESHGHTHTPLTELDPATFGRELDSAAAAIEDATGDRPTGFRAPNFSVSPDTEWAFDVLEDRGYRYDSSVFPVRTPMYGVSRAPIRPYTPARNDAFSEADAGTPGRDLREFPLATLHPRVRVPIAGGFYGRVLPRKVLEWGIRALNRQGVPATLYFHPWEFNPAVVREDVAPHRRFVSFHGIDGAAAMLDALLSTFEFDTVGSYETIRA